MKELFSKASPLSEPTLLAANLSDLDKLRVNVTIKNNLTSQVIISSQTNVQSKAALDVLYFAELVGLIFFFLENIFTKFRISRVYEQSGVIKFV